MHSDIHSYMAPVTLPELSTLCLHKNSLSLLLWLCKWTLPTLRHPPLPTINAHPEYRVVGFWNQAAHA